MIIGCYARCETCGQKYILRIGLGLEDYQPHTFDCKSCQLPISLKITRNTSGNAYQPEDNIVFEKNEPQDGIIINLHPFFAFSSDEINSPRAFPSLFYIPEKILPYLRKNSESKSQDVGIQFDLPDAAKLWKIVEKIFILRKKSKQSDNIKKQINFYKAERKKNVSEITTSNPKEVAFDFFDNLFYPRLKELVNPVIELIKEVQKNNSNLFSEFLDFYSKELKQKNLRLYLSIFSDYFDIYYQLKQMLIHARINDENVDDKIVSSKKFEGIKLYYGQAYESITDLFVTFACLNNIWMGRAYNQFEEMTLNKYLNLNKSQRYNCFKKTQQFYNFTDGLDNTLRNGSHHAKIWRNSETIYYISSGNGSQKEIPYSRYLHLCNKLTISLAALFIIELELQYINKRKKKSKLYSLL